jgi:hypothetical protein
LREILKDGPKYVSYLGENYNLERTVIINTFLKEPFIFLGYEYIGFKDFEELRAFLDKELGIIYDPEAKKKQD